MLAAPPDCLLWRMTDMGPLSDSGDDTGGARKLTDLNLRSL